MATDFHAKGLASGLKPKSMGGSLGEKKAEPKREEASEQKGSDGAIEVHDNGDGTASTVIRGEKTDHPDHMHAVAHVAHHLMPESKHFHAKHDGFSGHTHSVGENGEHSETQEHDSNDGLHSAMEQALGHNDGDGDEENERVAGAEPEPTLGGFQG